MRDLVPRPGIETWAPCTGSTESYPVDHQGSPTTTVNILAYLPYLHIDVLFSFSFFLSFFGLQDLSCPSRD